MVSARILNNRQRARAMPTFPRRTITVAAVALGLLTVAPAASAQMGPDARGQMAPAASPRTPADDATLLQALRAGGHVILIRHGATFTDQADTDPFNFDNIAAQRQLNDKGKALAKAFGEALRQAAVPIGKVYTSKFHRAYETATLAGFTNVEKTVDLTLGGLIISPDEEGRRAEALRAMLATLPEAGTNTLLVTHKPNLLEALGKEWWDAKEGEASIFRPENGKYVLVARVQMADWARIAKAATQ
jgi:broad specificity phosphatase PhoE